MNNETRVQDLPVTRLVNSDDLFIIETESGTYSISGEMLKSNIAPIIDSLSSESKTRALSANMGRKLSMDKFDECVVDGRYLLFKANGQVVGKIQMPDDSTVIIDNLITADSNSALSARQGLRLKTELDNTNIKMGNIDSIQVSDVYNIVDAINVLNKKPNEQRPVVDNLYTGDSEKALTANMGKELSTQIIGTNNKIGEIRYLEVEGKTNIVDALNYAYKEAKSNSVIVDNLTEGGHDKGLSAEMGKNLSIDLKKVEKAIGVADNMKIPGIFDLVSAVNYLNEKPQASLSIIDTFGSTSSRDAASIRLVSTLNERCIDGITIQGGTIYGTRGGHVVGKGINVSEISDTNISTTTTYSSKKVNDLVELLISKIDRAERLKGVIQSPDGSFWRLKVSNTGVISTEPYVG